MNIVYSSSDSYAEICGISLVSLLENNKNVKEINIYIINNNISNDNIKKFYEISKKYKRKIIFEKPLNIEKIANTEIYVGRWNIGTFYRLYLSSILSKDINKVIYLDCDTIIRKSLEDIYSLDLGGCSVAGSDDCRSDLYRIDVGQKPGDVYVNNGFLLINLDKWRKENIERQFTAFINIRKGDITYMDQGVLNGVLGPLNQIFELKPKYNAQRIFFDFSYKDLLRLRKPTHFPSYEDYLECINDPIIVHFTPTFITGTRPWQNKDNHKFRTDFLYYKKISPWMNEPLREDDRKKSKKIMTLICKLCPKIILIPVMSYLHTKWYPNRRIHIAKKNISSQGNKSRKF